jgi:ATP-binding cassette subfamily E protein 1
VLFEGTPAVESYARVPEGLLTGMNKFLKSLNITFRRDPTNFRPRINKLNSQNDSKQKAEGAYFFVGDD